jgi:hypothetical protein
MRFSRVVVSSPCSRARIRSVSAIAIAAACFAGFVGACVTGVPEGRPDDDPEGDRRIAEDAEEIALVDELVELFEGREATARDAYAECWAIAPARAELDAWIEVGLEGDDLRATICGAQPAPFDPNERLQSAFAACLDRAPSDEETKDWLSYGLSAEELFLAVCESEESQRRIIEAAIVRYFGRDPLPHEVDSWLDADLPRAALLREIGGSLEAARADVMRDALDDCAGANATLADYLEDDASVLATDVVDQICGAQADDMLTAAAHFVDCNGRQPSDAELQTWAKEADDTKSCPSQNQGVAQRNAIAAAYTRCLGRAGSQAEIDSWVASGQTTAQIVAGICSSPEARRHSIAEAYRGCLGRVPRPDEVDAWANSGNSNAEITRQICSSPEARRYAVRLAYQQCLRRTPSEAEIDSWANTQMSAGEIRHAICNSEEAQNLPPPHVSHVQPLPPGWFYDIWRNNCHTAANLGVLNSPSNTGIIACRPNETGMGPRGRGVGGHTFNYVLEGGNTSYYNWGPPPCVCPGTPPANYSAPGCHRTCVEQMCGGQFDPNRTSALPVGRLVEVPGVSICAGQTFDKGGSVSDCNKCCDDRANTNWSGAPDDPHNANRESYRAECKSFCQGFFR